MEVCVGWGKGKGDNLPTVWAPASIRAFFAAAVPDGSGHVNGSPSAPRGRRVGVRVWRLVGMASAERAKVTTIAATVLSLNAMMRK